MKTNITHTVGYGLYYRAINQLIKKTNDRWLFQLLIDLAKRKLQLSELPQITLERSKLCRMAGLESNHAGPASFKRLEALGLISVHSASSLLVNCDAYVTAVIYYESLSGAPKSGFASEFQKVGVVALEKFNVPIIEECGNNLLSMMGSTMQFPHPNSSTEKIQSSTEKIQSEHERQLEVELKKFSHQLKKFSSNCNSSALNTLLEAEFFQLDKFSAIKSAFESGELPSKALLDPKLELNFFSWITEFFQFISQKQLNFFSTDIIYNINKNINENGFENFGKVEVVDFNQSSAEVKEDLEEIDELSQQALKRAERSMRDRNPYRNKPFIKSERAYEIVECLDEVVKSPVDFFINQFWEGIYNLYLDNYKPSDKIDEEGDPVEDSQISDWTEMIGAPIPQDEVYNLAKNVYEDLVGAVEQGKFVYGPNNEWEVKFGFDSFEDFIPYQIFQWTPCTMQDKSVPALKVAIDRFYDIEATDVFTPSKADKRTKNAQNKKLVQRILSAEYIQLTPIEVAIKKFYEDFVVTGEDNVIDEFTDGRGTPLESGGGLPDHLLKPWCYRLSFVGYNELTGVLNSKYKPIDGLHKKAYIFSAELVVEWNERNGYRDSISHSAIHI